jgi:hypothetical protein
VACAGELAAGERFDVLLHRPGDLEDPLVDGAADEAGEEADADVAPHSRIDRKPQAARMSLLRLSSSMKTTSRVLGWYRAVR